MDIIIVVSLLLVGVILILVEIFFLPGITFAAVEGAIFSVGGVIYSYSTLGTKIGHITLVCTIVIFILAFILLIKSKALNKIALTTEIKSSIADSEKENVQSIEIGMIGKTISILNPIGKVKVNNISMEAKSIDGYIKENEEVEIIKVSPTQVIVKLK